MDRVRKREVPELARTESEWPTPESPTQKRGFEPSLDFLDSSDGANWQGGRKLTKVPHPSASQEGSSLDAWINQLINSPPDTDATEEQYQNLVIQPLLTDSELERELERAFASPEVGSPLAAEAAAWFVPHDRITLPTPEKRGALVDKLRILITDKLQRSDFRKKDGSPLNDYDIQQVSEIISEALFGSTARLKAGKENALQTRNYPSPINPARVTPPVTIFINEAKDGKARIEITGKTVGSGLTKKAKQRLKISINIENPDVAKLSDDKVLIRAKKGKDVAMRQGLANLETAIAQMTARGIVLDDDFRVAGRLEKQRTQLDGRTEGIEKRYRDNFSQLQAKLTPKQKMQILADVAKTLQKFHQAGYTHGDIKPENILVTRGDNPRGYLTDFDSLAKEGGDSNIHTPGYQDNIAIKSSMGIQTRFTDIFALVKILNDLQIGSSALRLSDLVHTSRRVLLSNFRIANMNLEETTHLKNQLKGDENQVGEAVRSTLAKYPAYTEFLAALASFQW